MNEATKNESKESHKAAKRASRKGKGREVVAPPPKPSLSSIGRKVSAATPINEIEPWKWSSIADPSVPLIPAVFTKDARYAFSQRRSVKKKNSRSFKKDTSFLL